MDHFNSGRCDKCHQLMDKYPVFNLILREWFEKFQFAHPEAHISCAGRGKEDQDFEFEEGLSRSKWGESPHNYNCAFDIFELQDGSVVYERKWFETVLEPNLPGFLEWRGKQKSESYELPHVQLREWIQLKKLGAVKLVE